MQLIDTHSHLYEPEFDEDRDEAVARAREAGLERLLFPAIDPRSNGRMVDAVRRYGDFCLPMMGLHPTSINENPAWREDLAEVERLLLSPPDGIRFCAVGEIGLDLYWNQAYAAEQLEAFEWQCRLAMRLSLPVAIHTRAAWPEMEASVARLQREAEEKGWRFYGVFHAFAEDAACYRRLKALVPDFKFGIGGVVTFKKSLLAETVKEMEMEDLLLETDCPYLTPTPFRGKRNESGYILYICRKVAELKGVEPELVAKQTSCTARALFALDEETQQ